MYWFRRLCLTCRNMTWLGPKRWLLMFVKHVGRNEGCWCFVIKNTQVCVPMNPDKNQYQYFILCSSTMATENRSFADDGPKFPLGDFDIAIFGYQRVPAIAQKYLLTICFDPQVQIRSGKLYGASRWPWLALGFNMFRTLPGSEHFCVAVDLGDQDRNPAVKLTNLAWLEDVWGVP